MTDQTAHAPKPAMPSVLSPEGLLLLLFAGGMGTAAFGIFGDALSPLLGGSRLAPVPLAASVFKSIAGYGSQPIAHLMHYFAGIVGYPLGFALIARPLWMAVAPWMPWYVVAVAFGISQWVFALYVLAHLVAGQAAFLNFTGITWAALWGHIIYALVAIGISTHLRIKIGGTA